MHLAAAVETRPGRPKNRACVVIAGGREPAQWEAYPHHQYISTNGALWCCEDGGCWKSRCQLVGDGDEKDTSVCSLPVQIRSELRIPRCLDMISAQEVIRRIEWYYEGGALQYNSGANSDPLPRPVPGNQQVDLLRPRENKLREPGLLQEELARRRRRGERVVFTNGCFDMLHLGHVRCLQEARALGDILVVGLNNDASVRRLKGRDRPLNGASARAAVLSALACVDYVVFFEEETPLALISAFLPDILVKGGDYQPGQVVGKEIVEASGGRVVIVPLVAGFSTTRLVAHHSGTTDTDRVLQEFKTGGSQGTSS